MSGVKNMAAAEDRVITAFETVLRIAVATRVPACLQALFEIIVTAPRGRMRMIFTRRPDLVLEIVALARDALADARGELRQNCLLVLDRCASAVEDDPAA
jgi:hypothetical protein